MDICFHSLGYAVRSAIGGSYGNSMFNFLRDCQAVFQISCTILHYHWQCMKIPISHILVNTYYCLPFFSLVILVGVKWHLILVLICISLVTNNVELMCLLANYISSLERCVIYFEQLLINHSVEIYEVLYL